MSRWHVIAGVVGLVALSSCSAEYDAKRCDKGDMSACAGLAESYDVGARGLPKDEHKAFELFQKACDGNLVSACVRLGGFYEEGRGVPVSYPKARALFERACTKDEGSGCNALGVLYRDGHGVPVDLRRALALFTRACADSVWREKWSGPKEHGPACPNKRAVEARLGHAK
jgi:TPR repeat protein